MCESKPKIKDLRGWMRWGGFRNGTFNVRAYTAQLRGNAAHFCGEGENQCFMSNTTDKCRTTKINRRMMPMHSRFVQRISNEVKRRPPERACKNLNPKPVFFSAAGRAALRRRRPISAASLSVDSLLFTPLLKHKRWRV
jgi:hypothetical protein